MDQPDGFVDHKNPHLVCKLHKAIYGLKQASRQWHSELSNVLLKFGFQQCKKDELVFYFRDNETKIYLAVYMDDIFV